MRLLFDLSARGGPPQPMPMTAQRPGPTSPQSFYPPMNMAFAIPYPAPPPAMVQPQAKRAPEPIEDDQGGPKAKKVKAAKTKAPEPSGSCTRLLRHSPRAHCH